MKHLGWFLALVIPGMAAADDGAQKVMQCMRANVPAHLSIGSAELTRYDRTGGAFTLQGRLFSARGKDGLTTATLYIDAPADYKGSAYLAKETRDYLRDGMFVYLPAVKRVRRISGNFADGALMGTNFSYLDFKEMQNAFGDLSAKLEAEAEVNGRPAYVLAFAALPGIETRYTSVRAWVDKEACVAVKAEFSDGQRVAKVLSSPPGAVKKSGKTWYVAEIEMKDASDGTRSVLKLDKLDSVSELSAQYFDPNAFYLR